MPIEVGNCLYTYITKGRPQTHSDHIFVKHMVPYNNLRSKTCASALKKALSDKTQKFHITRKTFASRMLAHQTKPSMIAETLGHKDNSHVMTYLEVEASKMRKCAMSLNGIEIKKGILL